MFLELTGFPLVLVSLIAFILIIGIIIILHELGHFYFAKRAGILCHEFSIGMGPILYKKKMGETLFCIRAIPLGGYVAMAGEEISESYIKKDDEIGVNLENDIITEIILDEDRECNLRGKVTDLDLYAKDGGNLFITLDDQTYTVKENAELVFEKDKRLQITPYERSFESKTMLQRILTIIAGPIMNLILAIVIYLIASFATGVADYSSNVVGTIASNSPAAAILEVGDTIDAVNGVECKDWKEFQIALEKAYEGSKTELTITYTHNGVSKTTPVSAQTIINSIGISNINAKTNPFASGVILGSTGARYKTNPQDSAKQLKANDVITGVKYFISGTEYEKTVSSWSDLIEVFDTIHSASEVRFSYYSFKTPGDGSEVVDLREGDYIFVDYADGGVLETYTDEVLNNQRIDKIRHYIGVSPRMKFSFFGCIGQAFSNFGYDFTLIFRTLKLLIAPSDVRQIGVGELSSFVGIFEMVKRYIGNGFVPLLSFMALLSVNIGVMNLLPIPALDGGRLMFLLYELITRKKPSKKVENIINNVFFILLLILLAYITVHDIIRLF